MWPEIVLVSTAEALRPDSFARVAPLCAAVLTRLNVGLDFGSWRAALDAYPWLVDAELLVLANDSVYGPLGNLDPLFAAMNEQACDFWGMTEARQPRFHLQSYFLAFKRRCLASDAFRAFFAEVAFLSDKQQVIDEYELTLAGRLAASGLRWAAVAPGVELGWRGINPMHQLWRSTLEGGVPFVEIELLRDNPLHADLRRWEPLLRRRFGYDTLFSSAISAASSPTPPRCARPGRDPMRPSDMLDFVRSVLDRARSARNGGPPAAPTLDRRSKALFAIDRRGRGLGSAPASARSRAGPTASTSRSSITRPPPSCARSIATRRSTCRNQGGRLHMASQPLDELVGGKRSTE